MLRIAISINLMLNEVPLAERFAAGERGLGWMKTLLP
jgi:hypothetical protein